MTHLPARLAALAFVALVSGCADTRSISNPGRPGGDGNGTYKGELSDFDVVGLAPGSESDASTTVALHPHMRVLLVQSGAVFPDERLVSALSKHFEVGVASGIPTQTLGEQGLRHAAARGGFEALIAYWGVLESSQHATVGAAASWVPIAGIFVPDSSQRMRIRLRIVVLDVRTSAMLSRTSSDRNQVELLLSAAVPTVVEALTHGM
jgi:hypothetical protein